VVRIWSPTTGRHQRLEGHTGPVQALAFADERSLLSGSLDGTVRWWDPGAGKELRRRAAPGRIGTMALAPGGAMLATDGSISDVLFWGVDSGRLQHRVAIRHSPESLHIALGGKLLISTEHGSSVVHLQHLPDGRELALLRQDLPLAALATAVSPDGRTLALVLEWGQVQLVELASGQPWLEFRVPADSLRTVSAIAFSPAMRILALADQSGVIHLRGLLTGKELAHLRAPAAQKVLAFSPCGRFLASAGGDSAILVWDVSGTPSEPLSRRRGASQDYQQLVADLAAEDAPRAYRAMHGLAANPRQALLRLNARLRPVPPTSAEEVHQWIADLGSERFEDRDRASRELQRRGGLVEAGLKKKLDEKLDLEVRIRTQRLLGDLSRYPLAPQERWTVRAMQVLEMAATREARVFLERLAKGAPGAHLTQEAGEILRRLSRQTAAPR
jgi:hypothetical protein